MYLKMSSSQPARFRVSAALESGHLYVVVDAQGALRLRLLSSFLKATSIGVGNQDSTALRYSYRHIINKSCLSNSII